LRVATFWRRDAADAVPTWLYLVLLRSYPKAFRARYESELVEGFEFMRSQEAKKGAASRALFSCRTAWDTVRSGIGERMSVRGYRLGTEGVRVPSSGIVAIASDLLLDLRYAVRTLRATPGYLFGIALTLALGIGANTALFSVAWGVFGRPLPFAEGNELIHVEAFRPDWAPGMASTPEMDFSVAELTALRGTGSFEDVAEYHQMNFTLMGPEGPDIVRAAVVSSNYFEFLGMSPMLGRVLDPEEDHLGADPVIVLSHEYWREVFDRDPDVIGSTVRMNGQNHKIVGVLPPIPQFPQENDIYLPISVCPTRSDAGFIANPEARMMTAYARLNDGSSVAAAQADLAETAHTMHRTHAGYTELVGGHDLRMTPLREELVRRARPVMWPLIVVSGLLLLIACANAAGLALARANRRMDDLAVRAALGAGWGRLARQLLTESVLLAGLGGVIGLGVAVVGSSLLATFAARYTTRAQEIRLDGVVLTFALTCSLATGLTFGVAPVAVVSRLVGRVSRTGMATRGLRSRWIQKALVAFQVMVTFSVLSGAGLLLRSFWKANNVGVGFQTENVVTAQFTGSHDQYMDVFAYRKMLQRARTELANSPSFTAVARIPWVPLAGPYNHREAIYVGGGDGSWHAAVADARPVDPEYFEVLDIQAIQGRLLNAGDTLGADPVAVVNETFFRRYMEGVADVGSLAMSCEPEAECDHKIRIVGVIQDTRGNGAEYEATSELFVPLEQSNWDVTVLVARVTGPPDVAMDKMVGVARSLDPELAVRNLGTLEDFRRETIAPRRFMAGLLFAFAVVAAGLALTGVFGVTALAAASRTRELGIRRAFGATGSEVGMLVLREGLAVVAIGSLGGLFLTWWTGELLRGLLFDIGPWDLPALAGAAGIFLGAAAVACLLPARRAARADVSETLVVS